MFLSSCKVSIISNVVCENEKIQENSLKRLDHGCQPTSCDTFSLSATSNLDRSYGMAN